MKATHFLSDIHSLWGTDDAVHKTILSLLEFFLVSIASTCVPPFFPFGFMLACAIAVPIFDNKKAKILFPESWLSKTYFNKARVQLLSE